MPSPNSVWTYAIQNHSLIHYSLLYWLAPYRKSRKRFCTYMAILPGTTVHIRAKCIISTQQPWKDEKYDRVQCAHQQDTCEWAWKAISLIINREHAVENGFCSQNFSMEVLFSYKKLPEQATGLCWIWWMYL